MSSSGRKPWPPEDLWARFSLPVPTLVQRIPSGQSKAQVFRIHTPLAEWALKASSQTSKQNRSYLSPHELLKKANLIYPEFIPNLPVISWVSYFGFHWELVPWIVGEHRLWNQMSEDLWTAAAQTLERVHQSLALAGGQSVLPFGNSKAFQIRFQVLQNAKADLSNRQLPWPSVFVGHPSWWDVHSCLTESVDLALLDLNRREKERVRLQPIHGDPHLGNWLWTGNQPKGLIDFLCPFDPIEADLARLGGSHVKDSFSVITRVCAEYKKQVDLAPQKNMGPQKNLAPQENLALELAYSGLVARLFRWRQWFENEPNQGLAALDRVTEIVGQIPSAFTWRKQQG